MIPLSSSAPPGVVTSEGLAADLCCFPTANAYHDLVASLRDDGFEMCVDLCGVDYLEHFDRWLPEGIEATRFEVVVNLLSLSKKERMRIRVQAGNDDAGGRQLFDLYPGTGAIEREAFDPSASSSPDIRISRAS